MANPPIAVVWLCLALLQDAFAVSDILFPSPMNHNPLIPLGFGAGFTLIAMWHLLLGRSSATNSASSPSEQ